MNGNKNPLNAAVEAQFTLTPGFQILIIGLLFIGCLVLIFLIRRFRAAGPAGGRKIQARLQVNSADGSTRFFPIVSTRIVIGRNRECGLVLDDSRVSASHAELVIENRAFILTDLESTNGTYVNNRKIFRTPLYLGDSVRIGSTELILMD